MGYNHETVNLISSENFCVIRNFMTTHIRNLYDETYPKIVTLCSFFKYVKKNFKIYMDSEKSINSFELKKKEIQI